MTRAARSPPMIWRKTTKRTKGVKPSKNDVTEGGDATSPGGTLAVGGVEDRRPFQKENKEALCVSANMRRIAMLRPNKESWMLRIQRLGCRLVRGFGDVAADVGGEFGTGILRRGSGITLRQRSKYVEAKPDERLARMTVVSPNTGFMCGR
jgi:hypothetical protein